MASVMLKLFKLLGTEELFARIQTLEPTSKYSSSPPRLSVRLSAMRIVLPSGLTQNWLLLGKLLKVSRAVGNDNEGLTMAWPALVASGLVPLTTNWLSSAGTPFDWAPAPAEAYKVPLSMPTAFGLETSL